MDTKVCRIPFLSMVLLFLLVLLCILSAGSIQLEMQDALTRCLRIIIPSLYAMMIVSQMLIATGIWRLLALPFRRISPWLFGLPDACFALLLLSQFAGYPVGANMIRTLTEQGELDTADAKRLLYVCYGSGPAFLLGLLGANPHRTRLFFLVFVANMLSNFVLTMMLFRRHPIRSAKRKQHFSLQSADATLLVDATTNSGRTLLRLCGIILCFSACTAMLDDMGLFRLTGWFANQLSLPFSVTSILRSFLEISNATTLSLPFTLQIPLFAGLLSFGGICVLLQVRAVAGSLLSLGKMLLVRLVAGILSAGFCRIGMSFFTWQPTGTAVSAISSVFQIQHSTIFPAILLLIMTLLLFREEYHLTRR